MSNIVNEIVSELVAQGITFTAHRNSSGFDVTLTRGTETVWTGNAPTLVDALQEARASVKPVQQVPVLTPPTDDEDEVEA